MIPLKLSLKNFLCYRENVPILDFAGMHVACLCGGNGHGKSALLDAITWCVWGKARARNQDELISYGADELRVELEFQVRDAQFRVIRSHSRGRGRGRPGATDLQLQLLNNETAQSISGNTVRESQAKIEHLVGMDYETFINSAFLMQGRADEFTNKTPAERKAVLASVLGLDVYDRLQVRARERSAESRAATDRSRGSLQRMQEEIEEIGDPTEELVGVARYIKEVEDQLTQRRAEVGEKRNRVNELHHQQQEIATIGQQIDSLRQELTQLESRAAAAQERIQQYQSVIQQAPEIESGLQRLREAQQRYDALEQSRTSFDALNQEKSSLAQEISNQRFRLESHLETLKRRVEQELSPRVQAGPELQLKSQDVQAQLDELAKQEQALAQKFSYQQSLATKIGQAQSLAERYGHEGQEVRQKLELLKANDNGNTECPVCKTSLGPDGRHRLAQSYEVDIKQKRELYRQNQNQLKKLETEQTALEETLPRQQRDLSQSQREAQVQLNDLQRRMEESQQAGEDLAKAEPELIEVQKSLASGDFAVQETARLKDLEQQIQALGYDDSHRQQSYTEMRQLQEYEGKQVQLSQALAGLPGEEESLSQAQAMLERRRQDLTSQEERLQTNETGMAELPTLEMQLADLERSVSELEYNRESALSRRGLLEGQVRRLEEIREAISAGSSQIKDQEEEQGIYQELVTSFGRQGVQAMLIETVVPRLEEEANLLLGRMTDNRMHVKLETQRERRTGRGEPIETLEINVSDELGPRSYEMYSGGEAFRVNLALRIALSKVLAQRTGAPLPTLFIDEGFGTQDASGRERILDVISAIQDDFDKIIVITHLDDLKDMFPVRIEVQKDASGSTFWLS